MNEEHSRKEQENTGEPARILLVDDRPINLDLLQHVLEPLGQLTVRANSGEEALQHLQKELFAMILLDVQMPGLNGIETAKLIRGRMETRDTPIIFITASDRNEERMRDAYALGAVDYVFKPITPEIIRAKVAVFIDLFKAKRQIEQFLNKSETYNRALLTAIPDMIFRIQRSGVIVDSISGESASKHVTEKHFLNKKIHDIWPPEATQKMLRLIQRSFAHAGVQHMEWSDKVQNISTVLEARISRCGADEVLIIVRDITQQRMLEKQSGTTQRLESVGRVAAGIAHDFNNVIMLVQSYATFLRDHINGDEEAEQHIDAILQGVAEAGELTGQLLAFSRGKPHSLEIVNLNTAITDLAKMLQQLGGLQVELHIEMEPDILPFEADLTTIKQVVMNLAGNACDAMPEGGKLTISTSSIKLDEQTIIDRHLILSCGEYVLLTVSDSGTGMDEETQAHMYEPFYSTKGNGRTGCGFGLATVYGIVKSCDGYILVESRLGIGTTFSIYFPRAN